MLVITIIVIIILAAAVILTISDNNPAERSREAVIRSDMQTMKEELALEVSEVLLSDGGSVGDLDGAAELHLTTAAKYPGKFTIENGKIYVTSNATEEEKEVAKEVGIASIQKWELTNDVEPTGLSVGDLITHKEKTTEKFYVIKVTGDTVAMLAAKNISTTGTLVQSDSAPTLKFSNTNYWKNETSNPLDLNKYTDKTDAEKTSMGVVSTDAIEIARAYGDTFDVTGRLMTVEEVEDLDGSMSNNSTSDCPDFINEVDGKILNYWLGSARDSSSAWDVGGLSSFLGNDDFFDGSRYGVRPVIEVLKSSIK